MTVSGELCYVKLLSLSVVLLLCLSQHLLKPNIYSGIHLIRTPSNMDTSIISTPFADDRFCVCLKAFHYFFCYEVVLLRGFNCNALQITDDLKVVATTKEQRQKIRAHELLERKEMLAQVSLFSISSLS